MTSSDFTIKVIIFANFGLKVDTFLRYFLFKVIILANFGFKVDLNYLITV